MINLIPLSDFFKRNEEFSDITFIKDGKEYNYKLSPPAAEIVSLLFDAYEFAADETNFKWTLTSGDLKEKVNYQKEKSVSSKFKSVDNYEVLISVEAELGGMSLYKLNFPPPDEVDIDS